MIPRDLVLGIDGGGAKTAAWLALQTEGDQEATVVGRGRAGGSNVQAMGHEAALANLDAAIDAAFAAAGLGRAPVAAAAAALAGSDREEVRRIVRQWADARRLAQTFRITHDAEPVLAAGCPGGWGAALIAGTGSLAVAVSPKGQTARAGGWGYLFGDEGSGYWLAVEGLRAAARAADGRGPATRLLSLLMERWNVPQPLALIPAVYAVAPNRAAIASLAEAVFRAAAEGDPVADALLARAAEELAAITAAAAKGAGIAGAPFALAATGGVLLNCEPLLANVCEQLAARGVAISSAARVPDPVWGAVLLARRAARPGGDG